MAEDGSGQELTIYHIPGCPFSERIEIMLALKGLRMRDVEIDISRPRPDWLLAKSGGKRNFRRSAGRRSGK